ncbi:hypothetical protein AC1031_021543 [Aphanomyces cochlioides]|nr:hypothetical protein AC1031_021543 [Aphanomyces cochlioides]
MLGCELSESKNHMQCNSSYVLCCVSTATKNVESEEMLLGKQKTADRAKRGIRKRKTRFLSLCWSQDTRRYSLSYCTLACEIALLTYPLPLDKTEEIYRQTALNS